MLRSKFYVAQSPRVMVEPFLVLCDDLHVLLDYTKGSMWNCIIKKISVSDARELARKYRGVTFFLPMSREAYAALRSLGFVDSMREPPLPSGPDVLRALIIKLPEGLLRTMAPSDRALYASYYYITFTDIKGGKW